MNVWLSTAPGTPMPRWSYDEYRKAARRAKRMKRLLKAPATVTSPKVQYRTAPALDTIGCRVCTDVGVGGCAGIENHEAGASVSSYREHLRHLVGWHKLLAHNRSATDSGHSVSPELVAEWSPNHGVATHASSAARTSVAWCSVGKVLCVCLAFHLPASSSNPIRAFVCVRAWLGVG